MSATENDHNYSLKSVLHDEKSDSLSELNGRTYKRSGTNCCVPRCRMHGYPIINGEKIRYHQFPSDESVKKQWLAKTRVDVGKTFKLHSRKTVCSLHFQESDYVANGYSKKKLKKDAVPSKFDCWNDIPHLQEKTKKERQPNKLQLAKPLRNVCTEEPINEIETLELYTAVPYVPEISDISNNVDTSVKSVTPHTDVFGSGFTKESFATPQNFLFSTHQVLSFARIRLESIILQSQILELEKIIAFKDEQLKSLQEQIESVNFDVDNLNNEEVQFYTGFPSIEVFNIVLELLNPGPNGENIIMKQSDGVDTSGKVGRKRCMKPREQFFLVLCRLRLGLFEKDLAVRFGIGKSTVSHIVTTWVNFMYLRLGSLNIWPSRAKVDKFMPSSFKSKYPSTRVIIDATELKVEMPSSLLLKSQSYSNYKSANTVKGLVGITPGGSICFVSQLYTGCISDKEITIRSGFLDLPFDEGDSIMADKGFDNIRPHLPPGVSLNIPPFMGERGQMSHHDVVETQKIASERIHVERAIRKIKEFHIFDQTLPLTLAGIANQMWTVCALLTLFQNPIISQ